MQDDIFTRLKIGELVLPDDAQMHLLRKASSQTRALLLELNNSKDISELRNVLQQITGQENDSIAIFTPIYLNYGKNLKIGKNVFINFDCTFLDLGGITIEDEVQIGPKVSLVTENHPQNPEQRKGLVCKPILIKRNAWIGANATILPGVTIGENSIVAAGAVVSKDVPDNTIVGGVPAKVFKNINE